MANQQLKNVRLHADRITFGMVGREYELPLHDGRLVPEDVQRVCGLGPSAARVVAGTLDAVINVARRQQNG